MFSCVPKIAEQHLTGEKRDMFLQMWDDAYKAQDVTTMQFLTKTVLDDALSQDKGTALDDKAKRTENTSLQDYLTQLQDYALFPWKRMQTMVKNFWKKNTVTYDVNERKKLTKEKFISKAKCGRLTPTEVMIGQYLFFAEDPAYGLECLKTLLFICEEEYRVQFHNWGLFESFDPVKQEMYGARVEKLQYPLFPDHPEFRELNAKLLAPNEDTLHGGSSDATLELEKMYDMKREGVLSGGGYCEAIYDARGQQIAPRDMSNIQQQLANLRAKVEDLDRKLSHHMNTPNHFPNTKQRATGTRQRKGNTGAGGSKGRGGTFATNRPYQYRGGGEYANHEFDESHPGNEYFPSERQQH
ncbi:TATE DNA Transposon [Trypanosoma theileri]|uniref:TATE DNA Transposon n=1 Tax=Trypanosoma theileri TaxID=67003 RepID=A0A1X0NLK8_9TRYP|nr:TATE DNA Transposon [Trypanosoma theileri]ORC85652.1 TATE DNA Transposon [Trypanosoma theileri]